MANSPPHAKPKCPLWKRRWFWAVLAVTAATVACIGPWPAYRAGFQDTSYAQATWRRLEALPLAPSLGPLQAGAAAVDITPQVGEPLAGYSGRKPKAADGVLSGEKLFAKALSLSNGHRCVTIVGGDILLVLANLRYAILKRVGIPPEDVYFTASHTHSGPGGFAPGWIEEVTLGKYDETILERLAEAFAKAIRRSRAALQPARVLFAQASPKTAPAFNRLVKGAPIDQSLACLNVLGPNDRSIGGLVTFSAHPTCLGKKNRKASGDYPFGVQQAMERRFGGVWLFASGAVGSARIITDRPRGPQRAAQISAIVAGLATDLAESALRAGTGAAAPMSQGADNSFRLLGKPSDQAVLAAAVLDVDLPQTQWRISRGWRLSPVLTALLHDRRSYIHALRINELVLLGMPSDYSGELARRLTPAGRADGGDVASSGLIPVVTSFNGDYIGYLLPHERYAEDHYESRAANFFGPWCGEYFHELSRQLVRRLAPQATGDKGVVGKELLQGNSDSAGVRPIE